MDLTLKIYYQVQINSSRLKLKQENGKDTTKFDDGSKPDAKPWKFGFIIVPSIATQWLNFLA